jgi:tRNA nucleotidyltransferase (CCA-adding enzyme)
LHSGPSAFWRAIEHAIRSEQPRAAVEELRARGGLEREMPELEAMFGIPQRADKHPEVDAGLHSLMSLEQAARLSHEADTRFAALVHDLGKTRTPRDQWPSHKGHEEAGVPIVEGMCLRLGAPDAFRAIAALGARWHGLAHRVGELRPGTVLEMLEAWDALRQPDRLERLIVIGMADKRGRTGQEDVLYPPGDLLRACRNVAASVADDLNPERRLQARIEAIRHAQVAG